MIDWTKYHQFLNLRYNHPTLASTAFPSFISSYKFL